MQTITTFVQQSAVGPIYVALSEQGICAVTIPEKGEKDFEARLKKIYPKAEIQEREPDCCQPGRWLQAYLKGIDPGIVPPLDLSQLSDFSQKVLGEVANIPFGQTTNYGAIAQNLGSPKAARAVGRAVGANPVPLFVPCHRVVGKDGSLTGFGSGIPTKKALLALERGERTLD